MRASSRNLGVAVACATVAALTACTSGGGGTSSGSIPPGGSGGTPQAPVVLEDIADDAVVVYGNATCEFSEDGVDADGEPGGLRVTCQLDMSDYRVTGTEQSDRYRFYAEQGGATWVWVAEQAVLTNAEGSWRGVMQAAELNAVPIGEAHYVGEGAYEGLVFHYYFFDPPDPEDEDVPVRLHGWVSGG